MPPKIIKISRSEDVSHVIAHIKSLKDSEVIFDIEKGSALLKSSETLKLIKKTGEVLGKNVKIETTDATGRLIAQKAGVLAGDTETPSAKPLSRVARSDIKPRFSDIMVPKVIKPTPRVQPKIEPRPEPRPAMRPAAKPAPRYETPYTGNTGERGSRLEIELAKTSSKFSKIFILCLVILVVTVFGLAVLLPKADVTVYARSESVSRDFELTVDRSVPTADVNNLQVPGVPISKSVSVTQTFPTTGTKVDGAKATGSVSIFNFTANILKLKAATTTLSANGKTYNLVSDANNLAPNGKATTGIQIVAATGGEDYNLPANTKFTIVNAALGKQNVYAINTAALTGGTTGAATKVLSQQDIDAATASLTSAILAQTQSDVSTESGTKVVVIDSGVSKEILAKTANKNVGDATDTFDMTMIAKVTGLGFKEDDVMSVMVAKINQVLSADKYLVGGSSDKYTANFKSVDQTLGRGILDMHFDTTAAYKVDTTNLAKVLAGKNESEIKEILLSKPEIDNVDVKFWPAWFVHKAPRFNGKINISSVLSPN